MPIFLENPIVLLLLLALPSLPLVARRRLALVAPWRARTILGTRAVSLAVVILALAGPRMPLNNDAMSVAFVVDSSASIAPETLAREEEWVRQALANMGSADQASVIAFSAKPTVVRPLSSDREINFPPRSGVNDSTNLSSAMKLASGLLPASGQRKVVFLSDGWDTGGQLSQSVSSLPAGTRLEIVPFPAMEGRPEVLIESVAIPSPLREGDSFDITAIVGSSHEGAAQVELIVDGKSTGSWQVQLGSGANLLSLSQAALPLGYHSVEVRLSAQGDTISSNNYAAGFVVVKPRGNVLLVEGSSGGAARLQQELEGSGLSVDPILVADLPGLLPKLRGYDAVVLDDVSGPSLSLDDLKALQSFTRDQGHGLFVLGGNNSFGQGSYANGLLEDILPVSSDLPPTRERGDIALILVVDKSNSMDQTSNGVSKIAMAREAALQAVGALKPEDQIGVLAFDTDPSWIVPTQRVGNDLTAIRSGISSLQVSGGTDIFTALQTAYDALSTVEATTKHITLLTDGHSWKGQYQALIQKMKAGRITLSTVGIGGDADTDWLSEMATLGDGRFYSTQQLTDIPNIVFRDVTAATKVARVEGTVNPVFVTASPTLRGMNRDQLPPLAGYVATQAKDGATVVLKSARGDPILAHWQYGVGRVVVWTSDSESMWSAAWLARPDFSRVWDQSVRWAMAPPVNRGLRVSAHVDGNLATITADAVDPSGQSIDLADTWSQINSPDGTRSVVRLQQTAPGRYEAAVSAPTPGLYRVDVYQARQGAPVATEASAFSVPPAPEYSHLGSNDALLKNLAAMTGGGLLEDPSGAFRREGMPSEPGWMPLWPYLLAIALLLLPVEVALRRLRTLPFLRPHKGERANSSSPPDRPGRAA